MILYGASGHAKVICSCLESEKVEIEGVFDDNPLIKDLDGYEVFGQYSAEKFINSKLIISIGYNDIRKKISKQVKHAFGISIHTSSICDKTVSIGEGSVLLHRSVVQRGTQLGRHVILNTNSSVDHDCKIEDFVHISPNACICGGVSIGEGTHIGAGAIVIQGISIGRWATIGAGAVIVKNVPDYAVVVGNPGKIIKYNKLSEH